jgi:hypothetical protein
MFEYVASGLSFLRLRYEETRVDPIKGEFNRMWGLLQDKYDHRFSLLYNAHIEKGFGDWFKTHYRGQGVHQIYADSGGLQMVTQGLNITSELKQEVYDSQAKYSDCAMSFDEIPVTLIGDRCVRSDINSKYFDRSRFEWCARESGRNLLDQINTFEKLNSESKPMFIAQGPDLDGYIQWTEWALEEIPKSLHDRIGGVAMGAAALGNGMLEDCKRAFYFTQIPIDNNHLHILGVGSITRLLPTFSILRSGLLNDVHISYDSTTHTSGVEMGRYFMPNGSYLTPGRGMNHKWHFINEDIKRNVPGWDYTTELFHKGMNTSVNRYKKAHNDEAEPPLLSYVANFTSSLLNFLAYFDKVRRNPGMIESIMNPLETVSLNALAEVKTREDFDRWAKEAGKFLPSQSIRAEAPNSLEDLFC